MNSDLLQGFYLGDVLIEPLKGQVSGPAGAQHIPPKAVEVLLCLASDPGELVTRNKLLKAVWGEGKGSQEALGHAVSEIRHALDDHADDPTFIQTLPKRGYRLIIKPELAADHSASVVLGAKGGAHAGDIGLFEDLQRRGVFETAVAYLILGWLLIQIADIVFAQLYLPEWTATFVTVFVIAGFPIAISLSWYLEFRDGRAVVDTVSPADARRRRFGRTYLSVVGALALAAVVVFVYDQSFGLPEAKQPATLAVELPVQLPPILDNSFAVLPFLNLDGGKETQIFADGLVDDVITQLSRVPGLRVASRGDSFTLAPNSASREVRDRLRVAMYLEGSVEMAADRLRVIVQMIDSESGFHVLSRKFDRTREDFFDIRDEITSLTVANVRVALPPGLRSSSLKVIEDPTLDAYVLYRQGIEALRQPMSMDAVASALGWFDGALAVDPEYAAALAGKCAVYVKAYGEMDDSSFIAKAQSACATALTLNPNLDIVHTALGDLHSSTGQWNDAEVSYQKALSIDPSNVESLTGLGIIYARQQRLDEAEASLRKAVDIHPGDSRAFNRLGTFLFQSGRFAEAVEQFQYVVGLQPTDMHGYGNLGAAYTLLGNFPAAAAAHQKAHDIEPTKNSYSNLGLLHYYMGNLDAAIESLTSAVELRPNDHLSKSNLGDALWIAGREDEARREFEKAEALVESALQVNPNDPFSMMDLAWIRAMLDKHDSARDLMDRARGMAPDDPYTYYYDGMIFLRAGDKEAALDALEIAADKGYSRLMLGTEPHLEELRNDARFAALVNTN
ncbi:MAG: tetratricopeptide repeat protein [Gammaproteobacteria bacterium]|nr:tetratricopeptide repeat protein [Gammaproteobacteria bacterium]NNL51309.1 tetratricopeptide repeat protein [Woeseiaceae bacterium]